MSLAILCITINTQPEKNHFSITKGGHNPELSCDTKKLSKLHYSSSYIAYNNENIFENSFTITSGSIVGSYVIYYYKDGESRYINTHTPRASVTV